MISERTVTLYDAADGKAFWKREDAEVYDKALPFEIHFRALFRDKDHIIDLDDPEVAIWKLILEQEFSTWVEGRETDKAYIEGHYEYSTKEYSSSLISGTIREVMNYCEKNFARYVIRHDRSWLFRVVKQDIKRAV